jgi:hypothetical protein
LTLPSVTPPAQLRRVQKLRDLVFYGIVLVQPIAAVPRCGLADSISHGHVVTVILIAMAASLLDSLGEPLLLSQTHWERDPFDS